MGEAEVSVKTFLEASLSSLHLSLILGLVFLGENFALSGEWRRELLCFEELLKNLDPRRSPCLLSVVSMFRWQELKKTTSR
jgi:hypothetical protein